MFSRNLLGLTIVSVLGGCAGAKPPAAAAANPSAPAVTVAPVVQAPQTKVPSEKLLGRWIAPASPEAIGYADLGALFGNQLIRDLLAAGMVAAKAYAPKETVDCAMEWVYAVREFAGFANGDEGLVILTYEPAALKTPIERCIQSFGEIPHVELGGKTQAYALDKAVLVIEPGVVLLGRRQVVQESLARQGKASWDSAVSLGKDQQLAFVGREPKEQLDIKGYLSVTNEQFVVHVDIKFADMAAAKAAADLASPERIKRELAGGNPQADMARKLVDDSWHVQQSGQNVAFEFGVAGSSTLIAERLGVVAALAVYGVKKYVTEAKVVEARATVATIAKQLAKTEPKRFTSLPPVPVKFELLQGKKYQSVPADWDTWKSIGFSRSDPQYYQYRVQAAKNGKTAEVIAEGDLDGNGKRSRILLSLEIDKKTGEIRIAPELNEQDPTE